MSEESQEKQAQWLHPYKWIHFLLNTNAHYKSTEKRNIFSLDYFILVCFILWLYVLYSILCNKKKKSLFMLHYNMTWGLHIWLHGARSLKGK